MYLMAVFSPDFCQTQHEKITDYLKSITANSAMELARKCHPAIDELATRLAKSVPGSTLLGANAALWQAFKKCKE